MPVWLRKLNHWGHYSSGTGSWALLPHETAILEAAVAQLDPKIRELVEAQLRQEYFIERSNVRINVLRFYKPDDGLRITEPDFDDLLYKVHIKVDGRKQTARVTFYEGYIFSVETRKPGKDYEDANLEVLGVELGKPKDSLTYVIDPPQRGRDF